MKLKIWILIILHYIVMFGTPFVASYFLLAEDVNTSFGGVTFYITIITIILVLFIRINTVIKKMKASYPKAIFKLFVTLVVLWFLYTFFGYVSYNFNQLLGVVGLSFLGRIVAFIFEIWALKLDAKYIDEIGVM